MFKIPLQLVALLAMFSCNARAQLLTEAFDYANPAGTQLSAITGWTSGAGNTAVTLQDGDLTGGGVTDPAVSNNRKVRMTAVNSIHHRAFSDTAIGSGSVYVSFHLNAVTLQTTDNYYSCVLALDNDGSVSTSSASGSRQARAGLVVYYQRTSSTTYRIGVRKNEGSASNGTTAWGSASFSPGDTVFVVAKYTFNPSSGDDTVALWLNPTSLGGSEDSAPTTTASTTGNSSDSLPLQRVVVLNGSSGNGGGTVEVDNIRVGQSWSAVTPAGPVTGTQLAFTTQPGTTPPGGILSPVVVQIQSANGFAAASNGVPITLSLSSGSGTLNGTLTVETGANGQAIFNDLSIDTAGVSKQFIATASGLGDGLTAATSAFFSIIEVPIGSKLTFTTPPVNGVINTPLNTIIVQIQDENGIAAASNAVPILLTLTSGTGNLLGTVTQNTDNTGKAQFNGLTLNEVGNDKQLTATASGIGAGLTDAVSPTFAITLTPIGAKLGFITQPASTGVNATMNTVVVRVQDANSAAVASNGVPVTLALTLGAGALNGTLTQITDGDGRATFSDLSIDTVGAAKQLTATASGAGAGLASAASSVFAVTGAAVTSPPVITQAVATAASMILRGTNGAPGGEYHVLTAVSSAQPITEWTSILTNTFAGNGSFDSTNAILPGNPQGYFRLRTTASAAGPDFSHVGFASRLANGTDFVLTGGTNGTFPPDNIVTVTNFAQLGAAISNTAPLIIQVQGTIHMRTNGNFYLRANKTLIGLGPDATLVGCLAMYGNAPGGHSYSATNIIIRNLTIRNPDGYGEDDAIAMKYGARNIWIDHCTIYDAADGLIDMTRECDFVTISWCQLYYTAPNGHENSILVGGNDNDTMDIGKSHLTFHHNWFGTIAKERMPSVRFGRAHVFNNYFNSPGNRYCTRARLYSEVLVENNFYDNVQNPWELATSNVGPNGKLRATGNITNNCVFTTAYAANLPNSGVVVLVDGSDTLSSGPNELNPPPYAYTLDPALDVPALVQANAGAGKGPFAP